MADNITIKDGNGSAVTLKTKDVGDGVECSQSIPSDTSGNPAWGTAGTPNANVMSVQGMSGGQALPVSGAVTANAGTNLNTSALALEGGGNLATLAGAVSGGKVKITTAAAGDVAAKVTDGTNNAAVKAASAAPVATDPALVVAISPNSVNANGQATMANSAPVVLPSNQCSMSATAAAVPGQADYEGAIAKTALPAAGSDGNLVGIMADKFGRQVMLPCTIRDLVGTATLTVTDATSHALIAAGGAGVFTDLLCLIVSNTSASSNSRVDVSDGTTTFSFQSIGGAPAVGIPFMGVPIPATTANTAWTVQAASAVTDLRVIAIYAKNK
jgi:hypothetical protein